MVAGTIIVYRVIKYTISDLTSTSIIYNTIECAIIDVTSRNVGYCVIKCTSIDNSAVSHFFIEFAAVNGVIIVISISHRRQHPYYKAKRKQQAKNTFLHVGLASFYETKF